jgi:hypothetical protein
MLSTGFKIIIINAAVILLYLVPSGCDRGLFFRSEPDLSQKTVLSPFDIISINGMFETELKNDTLFSLEITGRESILKGISFNVTGNALVIRDDNSFKWLPDYPVSKLTISFPDISTLNINSSSLLYSSDTLNISGLTIFAGAQLIEADLIINSPVFHLRTGTDNYGHYTLRGSAETSDLQVYGSAQVWAAELLTGSANIRNYSTGDCHVHALDTLRVWLEHYGNIKYYGSPGNIIVESRNSRGSLIPVNPD